jgi:hypothetical protein
MLILSVFLRGRDTAAAAAAKKAGADVEAAPLLKEGDFAAAVSGSRLVADTNGGGIRSASSGDLKAAQHSFKRESV